MGLGSFLLFHFFGGWKLALRDLRIPEQVWGVSFLLGCVGFGLGEEQRFFALVDFWDGLGVRLEVCNPLNLTSKPNNYSNTEKNTPTRGFSLGCCRWRF